MALLVRGAKIVNYWGIEDKDILIENAIIVKVGKNIRDTVAKTIDAQGKFVFPGFIDMHTHLRVPGREDEEDIFTGIKSAVKGGFTTILCMPNTQPPIDNYEIASRIRKEAEKINMADVFPVGTISKKREGRELSEFGELKKAGCLAVSDDGDCVANASLMRRALEYAQLFNLLVISHCEDKSLSKDGLVKESWLSSVWGLPSIPEILRR
ncbi:hypothetical protein DRO49_05730 [Candidatus Bathyarchaeota archaeon]|nr:MAG: hypothetical protein DRO49_05730 [Candidatus Bathyarchaeota archaeon]